MWYFGNKSKINELELATKKAIRVMFFKRNRDHTLPLFNSINLLNLHNQCKLNIFSLLWKILKGINCSVIQTHFDISIGHHFTRNNFVLPTATVDLMKRSVFFSGLKMWNNEVSLHLKQLPETANFKRRVLRSLAQDQGFSIK